MELSDKARRQSHPELWMLLMFGVKPDVLIKRGYSKATVYSYSRRIPAARKRINELIGT